MIHFDSAQPVTLIGGGEFSARDLDASLALAPRLVAVDGGAQAALSAGHKPELVIGDLDSISDDARSELDKETLVQISEQDTTDFDKALRSVRAPFVIAVGFLGARLDHQLAVLSTLIQHTTPPCCLLGAQEVVVHVPKRLSVPTQAGDVVSLFPMRRVTGRSTGLQWPIDGLSLAPDGMVGTSNKAIGPLSIEMEGRGLLAILPRSLLSDVTQAIAQDL